MCPRGEQRHCAVGKNRNDSERGGNANGEFKGIPLRRISSQFSDRPKNSDEQNMCVKSHM